MRASTLARQFSRFANGRSDAHSLYPRRLLIAGRDAWEFEVTYDEGRPRLRVIVMELHAPRDGKA